MRIPRGTTRSYAEIAKLMGRPTAYRAVAQACGANVLPVVIPCHRVVASDGSLGGFSNGIETKRQLLKMESVQM
ncbi:6-O-methylguanine DNA methyltransferase, DNA binding domain protein [Ancylostoma duodenale]|uniref:Methylated-DNA--protein-cysteine methyltransferase n=1 Tax=Ancylostoma duodenale TaxID=51022 RepID=A0A0C2FWS8_9BILA|nr:6-O-methylguanine DNA methyltransferase, DNA binding domain protein [Ancylostoma duodenale]